MVNRNLLAQKRTYLAEKRTELAHERTLMAYVRTATTLILFGVGFLGFSGLKMVFFFYAGWSAICAGFLFIGIAIVRGIKHFRELGKIKKFFKKLKVYNERKK